MEEKPKESVNKEPNTELGGGNIDLSLTTGQLDMATTKQNYPPQSPVNSNSTVDSSVQNIFDQSNNSSKQFFGLETYSSDSDPEEYADNYSPDHQEKEWNSAIPEVAATIPISDDPNISISTFRILTISTILIVIDSFCSQFFFFRLNNVPISYVPIIILSYPMGLLLSKIPRSWTMLNPGPFNYKEHSMIMIAATSSGEAYGIILLVVQRLFYGAPGAGINVGYPIAILFLISVQCLGFGLGGLFQRFLVVPAEMWWPENLVPANLIHTFHSVINKKITKLRVKAFGFFLLMALTYQFLPQVFMPLLQCISLLCIFGGGTSINLRQVHPVLSQLGSRLGGGVLSLTFDWNAISIFSPMITPVWAQMNVLFSNVALGWIIVPILYHFNVWNARKFPMFSTKTFDENGNPYNLSPANTPMKVDFIGESTKTPAMRLSIYWALAYGCGFAALSSVVVHFFLNNFQGLKKSLKQSVSESDIHSKLMKTYKDVPLAWYIGFLAAMILCSMFALNVSTNDFQLLGDFWVIPLALLMTVVFIVPVGILRAVANQSISLNIISEMVMGYLKPGFPIANAAFKAYTTSLLNQSLNYLAQLKFAYYMKLPPRQVFFYQIYGSILGAIVNYATMDYMIDHVPQIRKASNSTGGGYDNWSGQQPLILDTATKIWGLLGPKKFFDTTETPYVSLYWFFLAGAVLPVITFYLAKQFPRIGFQYVNWPIIFVSTSYIGVGYSNAILSTIIVVFISQVYCRKYHRKWYDRYNYILSAALDCGAALIPLIVFTIQGLTQVDITDQIPVYALNPNASYFGGDYCGVKT
ncbi:hypothetical protein HDV01_005124 [Terramyces sp. JEL0728]|nr:hypothetical protein HDV01_005124 [Terramyces sp. JEL0728]